GNVQFATLPIESFGSRDGQDVNIVDVAKVQKEVRIAFGLQAPDPPPRTTVAVAPPLTATVDVLNGDGRPGLATTVSQALAGAGLTPGDIGNSTSTTTAVTYGAGAQPDAVAIASLFDGVTAAPDTALPAGRVSVVLGKGFTPAADLAQRAIALKAAPAAPATTSPPPGPQGLPVDGSGIPCVD
ncbi:MAG: LytR C-terminal domain-containing protein, partial [Mycobacteriaceae bacterium]